MKRIELSIKTTYLPTWGVWEGVRELVQNGKDAETQLGASFSVRHADNVLRIVNEGCVLPREALLFGHTTKADDESAIGQFGEGLKLGMLALVRCGCRMEIRTGTEKWVPLLSRSKAYASDVLVVNITEGLVPVDGVHVRVWDVDWKSMKDKFLFLDAGYKRGRVLLDRPGQVFVKGVFVCHNDKLEHGYDFANLKVDRDRRTSTEWDMDDALATLWSQAVEPADAENERKALVHGLEEAHRDFQAFEYLAYRLPEVARAHVVENFSRRQGENACPVANQEEAETASFLGYRGVVVSAAHRSVLSHAGLSLAAKRVALASSVAKTWPVDELSPEERAVFLEAHGLATKARPGLACHRLEVCTFRDPKQEGMWSDGFAKIARSVLSSRRKALQVIVHELAHGECASTDGTKEFEDEIQGIWSDIVESLLC